MYVACMYACVYVVYLYVYELYMYVYICTCLYMHEIYSICATSALTSGLNEHGNPMNRINLDKCRKKNCERGRTSSQNKRCIRPVSNLPSGVRTFAPITPTNEDKEKRGTYSTKRSISPRLISPSKLDFSPRPSRQTSQGPAGCKLLSP